MSRIQPSFGAGPLSPFFSKAMRQIPGPTARAFAAIDVGCGFGRHAVYLAERGYSVTAIDIKERSVDGFSEYLRSRPALRVLTYHYDAFQTPSIWASKFDLCIVVDFVRADILPVARDFVRPGGYLVYQSISNRGENWKDLPATGKALEIISTDMDVCEYEEQHAGPQASDAVTVRFLARKRDDAGDLPITLHDGHPSADKC